MTNLNKIKTFRGGHSYFIYSDLRLHIADDSGATPLETEDGDLIVDTSGYITASDNCGCVIPLFDTEGKRCSTIANLEEALWLINQHGMDVDEKARERLFGYEE